MNSRRALGYVGSRSTLVAWLVAAAALLAACGGGSSGTGSDGPGSSGGGSSSATVRTTSVSGYGTVLASGTGKALYLLTADPSGGSRCTGSCTTQWHPLTVSGSPHAGQGVKASLLSTFRRGDGSTQVLYNHHALYTYSGAGAASGAGIAADGGIWYLVSPAGKAVRSTTSGGY